MKPFIDTLFNPLLNWLNGISATISNSAVPDYYTLNISNYLRPFVLLGTYWMIFIGSVIVLSGIYGFMFLTSANIGIVERLRQVVKWW